MRLLLPFILFILSFTISAFPVHLNSRSSDGVGIPISKWGSVFSSGYHQAQSCTEGAVQRAWRRAFRDDHAGLPQNVYESTNFEDGGRSYMALIMVIENTVTEGHLDAISAFHKLNMLLGLGRDTANKQWFIVIKRVGNFAVYLDPPKDKSKTLQDKLKELIKEEERRLTKLKVTVLKREPQFYTFWDIEGRDPRALPMFGAIGEYTGGSPSSYPEVEEFCPCNQHVHRTASIPHKC